MKPVTLALLGVAAFAAYQAITVSRTGFDGFSRAPVSGQDRRRAALLWGGGAAVADSLAIRRS